MQQWYQCPSCGGQVVFGARFCGNCGTQLNWPTQQPQPPSQYQQQIQPPPVYQQLPTYQQQPITQRKPTSGWAKFGKAMVIIGILCLVAAPVVFIIEMLQPGDIQGYELGLVGKCIIAGIVNLSVGLPLMRQG